MRTSIRVTTLLGAAVVVAACSAATIGPATAPPAPDATLPAGLVAATSGEGAYAHLVELQRIADENDGTRALGTPGYDASVEYTAEVLRAAGYDVQTPEFTVRRFSVQEERLALGDALTPVSALGYSPATPAGGVTGPLTVVDGEGCEPADLAGIPAGSVVLVQRGTCTFAQKVTTAAAAGAAAVLVANTEDEPLSTATLGGAGEGTIPAGGLSRSDAEALARQAGDPVTLVLTTVTEETTSRNVVAQTRTGNPEEVVMAGGHLDSVPEGPGVNDNGSGVAALLETAVRLGGSPAVTNAVRFAFWGAEEVGLVGSTEYVRGLDDAGRARIALYLNLDMVASPNAAYFVYDGDDSDRDGAGPGPLGSATIERVLVEGLAGAGVTAAGTDFSGRSDYGPFIEAEIPSGGLFTGASEIKTADQAQLWGGTAGDPYDPCYHQDCDRIDTVDRTALDRNTDAVAAAVARFALSTAELPQS